jgi:hypothetical protein
MTRSVPQIIDGLRNAYGEHNTSEIAREARALLAHIDAQEAALRTVERWANHHARKPQTTAEEALGVIQHHPAIRAITASYADGVVPDTPDPYAEIARLRAELEQIAVHLDSTWPDRCQGHVRVARMALNGGVA